MHLTKVDYTNNNITVSITESTLVALLRQK